MPYYAQIKDGHLQGIVYYSLPPSEAEFAARLLSEGLELREIPAGEDRGAIYEAVDPNKPDRGVRISPAWEQRARLWPRLAP